MPAPRPPRQWPRLRIGPIEIDAVTFEQALDHIVAMVDEGRGGGVFTPNIDHVVNADSNPAFREAYEGVELSLVDGMPLVWASHLLGAPLPEKISGSDLVLPLMARAAERRFRVFLLGAGPGIADRAAKVLRERHAVDVVGTDAPMLRLDDPAQLDAIVSRVRAAEPHLLLVAFGAPKQELFIHRAKSALAPTVALGVGATLDFIAGEVQRAPRFISQAGLEWLYRLLREPRRLWRRYLINDPKFAFILARALAQRARPSHQR